MKMRAITIRQPWAWLIIRPDLSGVLREHAVAHQIIKDIENRSWSTKVRGPILIHAAKGMTQKEFADCMLFAEAMAFNGRTLLDGRHPLDPAPGQKPKPLDRGGIIGYAEVTDCTDASTSPWFMGKHGFKLEKQTPLPFHPCKGALSLFTVDVPDDYLAAIPGFKASP